MRFAILGDSLQGMDMARALVETGRHEIVAYCPRLANSVIERFLPHTAKRVGDIEEILADPSVEAIIVAIDTKDHLRRTLQSERHVICVFPSDPSLESAYEAAMIQSDTGRVLMPLITEFHHPAIQKLAELIQNDNGAIGAVQLIVAERRAPTMMGVTFPGWDVLRALRGEIAEVAGFAETEHPGVNDALIVGARFERGGLVQMTFVPRQSTPSVRWTIIGTAGQADLVFSKGCHGPATLIVRSDERVVHEEKWDQWNPGPALVDAFESAVERFNANGRVEARSVRPSWDDAVRCLELDDAARRSIEKRRASTLEYQDASEEVGFKGTMTLVGCGMLWGIVILVVLSRWIPWLGWGVVPLLIAFLIMQGLRWALPRKK